MTLLAAALEDRDDVLRKGHIRLSLRGGRGRGLGPNRSHHTDGGSKQQGEHQGVSVDRAGVRHGFGLHKPTSTLVFTHHTPRGAQNDLELHTGHQLEVTPVPLMAGVLVQHVALWGSLEPVVLDGPRLGKYVWICDRRPVSDRVGVDRGKSLHRCPTSSLPPGARTPAGHLGESKYGRS